MAFEPKEGKTTVFKNEKWTGDKQPVFKGGKLLVDGKLKEAAMWAPQGFTQEEYMALPPRLSLNVSEPFAARSDAAPALRKMPPPPPPDQIKWADELDDDVPF